MRIVSVLPLQELKKLEGIGNVRAIELQAIFEMTRRINSYKPTIISNIDKAVSFAHSQFSEWTKEYFVVILVGKNKELLYCETIYKSNSNSIAINPKDIISLALKKQAENIYCFHNHPSGNINPSVDDILLTKRLDNMCSLMGIILSGHIIISKNKQYKKIQV